MIYYRFQFKSRKLSANIYILKYLTCSKKKSAIQNVELKLKTLRGINYLIKKNLVFKVWLFRDMI